MEKMVKLCPRLTKIKVLMEDLNFRYFEMFPHLEEVNRDNCNKVNIIYWVGWVASFLLYFWSPTLSMLASLCVSLNY